MSRINLGQLQRLKDGQEVVKMYDMGIRRAMIVHRTQGLNDPIYIMRDFDYGVAISNMSAHDGCLISFEVVSHEPNHQRFRLR